jgi:hypothetical protein
MTISHDPPGADQRVAAARKYLGYARKIQVADLPHSALMRMAAELRRQLGQVLDVIAEQEGLPLQSSDAVIRMGSLSARTSSRRRRSSASRMARSAFARFGALASQCRRFSS